QDVSLCIQEVNGLERRCFRPGYGAEQRGENIAIARYRAVGNVPPQLTAIPNAPTGGPDHDRPAGITILGNEHYGAIFGGGYYGPAGCLGRRLEGRQVQLINTQKADSSHGAPYECRIQARSYCIEGAS